MTATLTRNAYGSEFLINYSGVNAYSEVVECHQQKEAEDHAEATCKDLNFDGFSIRKITA